MNTAIVGAVLGGACICVAGSALVITTKVVDTETPEFNCYANYKELFRKLKHPMSRLKMQRDSISDDIRMTGYLEIYWETNAWLSSVKNLESAVETLRKQIGETIGITEVNRRVNLGKEAERLMEEIVHCGGKTPTTLGRVTPSQPTVTAAAKIRLLEFLGLEQASRIPKHTSTLPLPLPLFDLSTSSDDQPTPSDLSAGPLAMAAGIVSFGMYRLFRSNN